MTENERGCAAAVVLHAPVDSWLERAVVVQTLANHAKQRGLSVCVDLQDAEDFTAYQTRDYPVGDDAQFQRFMRAWRQAREVVDAVADGDYTIEPETCTQGTHFAILPRTLPTYTDSGALLQHVCTVGQLEVYR